MNEYIPDESTSATGSCTPGEGRLACERRLARRESMLGGAFPVGIPPPVTALALAPLSGLSGGPSPATALPAPVGFQPVPSWETPSFVGAPATGEAGAPPVSYPFPPPRLPAVLAPGMPGYAPPTAAAGTFASPGGAVTPELRVPFGAVEKRRPPEFALTQFDPRWQRPPQWLTQQLKAAWPGVAFAWDGATSLYVVPGSGYDPSDPDFVATNSYRYMNGMGRYVQAYMDDPGEDPSQWQWRLRWVTATRVPPDAAHPYVAGEDFIAGPQKGTAAPPRSSSGYDFEAQSARARLGLPPIGSGTGGAVATPAPLPGYVDLAQPPTAPGMVGSIAPSSPSSTARLLEPTPGRYVWVPPASFPAGCPGYPYPVMPVPQEDYASGAWLLSDYVPSIPLPSPYDQVAWQCRPIDYGRAPPSGFGDDVDPTSPQPPDCPPGMNNVECTQRRLEWLRARAAGLGSSPLTPTAPPPSTPQGGEPAGLPPPTGSLAKPLATPARERGRQGAPVVASDGDGIAPRFRAMSIPTKGDRFDGSLYTCWTPDPGLNARSPNGFPCSGAGPEMPTASGSTSGGRHWTTMAAVPRAGLTPEQRQKAVEDLCVKRLQPPDVYPGEGACGDIVGTTHYGTEKGKQFAQHGGSLLAQLDLPTTVPGGELGRARGAPVTTEDEVEAAWRRYSTVADLVAQLKRWGGTNPDAATRAAIAKYEKQAAALKGDLDRTQRWYEQSKRLRAKPRKTDQTEPAEAEATQAEIEAMRLQYETVSKLIDDLRSDPRNARDPKALAALRKEEARQQDLLRKLVTATVRRGRISTAPGIPPPTTLPAALQGARSRYEAIAAEVDRLTRAWLESGDRSVKQELDRKVQAQEAAKRDLEVAERVYAERASAPTSRDLEDQIAAATALRSQVGKIYDDARREFAADPTNRELGDRVERLRHQTDEVVSWLDELVKAKSDAEGGKRYGKKEVVARGGPPNPPPAPPDRTKPMPGAEPRRTPGARVVQFRELVEYHSTYALIGPSRPDTSGREAGAPPILKLLPLPPTTWKDEWGDKLVWAGPPWPVNSRSAALPSGLDTDGTVLRRKSERRDFTVRPRRGLPVLTVLDRFVWTTETRLDPIITSDTIIVITKRVVTTIYFIQVPRELSPDRKPTGQDLVQLDKDRADFVTALTTLMQDERSKADASQYYTNMYTIDYLVDHAEVIRDADLFKELPDTPLDQVFFIGHTKDARDLDWASLAAQADAPPIVWACNNTGSRIAKIADHTWHTDKGCMGLSERLIGSVLRRVHEKLITPEIVAEVNADILADNFLQSRAGTPTSGLLVRPGGP